MEKIAVAILGATGMVGQRLVSLLSNHPWFILTGLAASINSKGKSYQSALAERMTLPFESIERYKNFVLEDATDVKEVIEKFNPKLVFSAFDAAADLTRELEIKYAENGIMVVSNSSAHRQTEDVPIILPEVNPHHLELLHYQRQKRNFGKQGGIVVKPNCSIQSYLPIIEALKDLEPCEVRVTTLQAVSGAGKTLATWPEMNDNIIPFIPGEEEKSESEPLKILGRLNENRIEIAKINISATCIRVPVRDGHMASIAINFDRRFKNRIQIEEIVERLEKYSKLKSLSLPSAPEKFIEVFKEDNRPQTRLDREVGQGMTICCGRIKSDKLFDVTLVGLSHNTLRGAAGGAVLTAELLLERGYL
jgi:aspartate-semialdehyde dehydrogenase